MYELIKIKKIKGVCSNTIALHQCSLKNGVRYGSFILEISFLSKCRAVGMKNQLRICLPWYAAISDGSAWTKAVYARTARRPFGYFSHSRLQLEHNAINSRTHIILDLTNIKCMRAVCMFSRNKARRANFPSLQRKDSTDTSLQLYLISHISFSSHSSNSKKSTRYRKIASFVRCQQEELINLRCHRILSQIGSLLVTCLK